MESFSVSEGQEVKKGQQLGIMGSTGRSTGTHLHLSLWDENGETMDPKQLWPPSFVPIGTAAEKTSAYSDEHFNEIAAVVIHEAGTNAESVRAVASVVYNRVMSDSYPSTAWDVITAPNQFESYFGGGYTQYLSGNDDLKNIVKEVFEGNPSIPYYEFRAQYMISNGSVDPGSDYASIGGNVFFNRG